MHNQHTGLALRQMGCNCAQAVLTAMGDVTGLSEAQSCRVACGFGGGMRAGELCGAATGAVMAIGMALGNADCRDAATRDRAYAAVIEFNRRFKDEFGSLICRDLLGCDTSTPEGKKHMAEHPEKKQICAGLIVGAERIARQIIAEWTA